MVVDIKLTTPLTASPAMLNPIRLKIPLISPKIAKTTAMISAAGTAGMLISSKTFPATDVKSSFRAPTLGAKAL